jgi:hypothetical protein
MLCDNHITMAKHLTYLLDIDIVSINSVGVAISGRPQGQRLG